MIGRTAITLSRAAFNANVSQINRITGYEGLALVIKSNAYGHGMLQMAQLGQEHEGVSWLCTVGVEEALFLRKLGISKPILVLSFLDGSIEQAILEEIHLCVSSYEEAVLVAAAAERVNRKAFVHVKIDTGMGRMGFLPEEAVQAFYEMKKLASLQDLRDYLKKLNRLDF